LRVQDYINQLAARFEQSELFFGHGTASALDDAVYLVYAGLELDFSDTASVREGENRVLNSDQLAFLNELAVRRIEQRIPVAYLLGKAWFAGSKFYCDERALVPRSPIAELIANRFEPMLTQDPENILDLCTGGGCIGIACALEFESSQLLLADVSNAALALASKNIELHQLQKRVSVQQSDLFELIDGDFDLIVSNPPYVSKQEVNSLPAEYRQEPPLGLLSDDDGLALPLQILREAADYLRPNGLLVMEVGYSHQQLTQRLPDLPFLWLEFEYGGEGVFALTASQLRKYEHCFAC